MKTSLKKTSRNLIILGILTIIMLTALILTINQQFERSSIVLRKNELKRLVDFGINSIEEFREEYKNGQISQEEALRKITNQVRQFTYEDELQPNYLFMSSYDGTMLVQPYQPEKEGTNQLELVDVDGNFIIKQLIHQAKNTPGYVVYKYYPPGSRIAYNKISYVVGLPELECYIGTGMYSADIEQIIRKHFLQTLWLIIITIIILTGSSIAIIYPILSSVQIIAGRLIEIGDKPLLEAPNFSTDKFNPKSDARRLLNNFSDITARLAARNRTIIKTAEEKDKLKTTHIKNTEMLIKEMNHRVKNNLQIIISLLSIQLNQTDNDEIRESHIETITRLESISIIHNMLYSNENYSTISGQKYLFDLVSYIIHSFGVDDNIRVKFDVDNTDFSIDQAVTLGIITNEILTNSIKYAFNPGASGVITITLNSDHNRHSFKISDNGHGIPQDKLENGNSSLGLSLIKNLSRQLGGTLEINNDNGTSYKIIF